MKCSNYIQVLALLILLNGCQDKADQFLETTIINLAKLRSQSVVKGDTTTLLQILDKDFNYITISGELLDRDRYIRELVSFKNDSSYWISQDLDSIQVKYLGEGNAALIMFTVHDQLLYEGKLFSNHCRSTFVYEKKGKDWKCLQGHTTKIE